MYYGGLRNIYTEYIQCTTCIILDHLYVQYGDVPPEDLEENDRVIKCPYKANDYIEVLFNQFKEGVRFVDNVSGYYSPNQDLYMGYIFVFNTGQLNCACEKWSNKIPADKTWVNFKTHFAQAHKRMRASQLTAENTGFGYTNAIMEEMVTQLANSAANTVANHNIVQALMSANTRLVAKFTTLNLTQTVMVAVAVADITPLRKQATQLLQSGGGWNGGNEGRQRQESTGVPIICNIHATWQFNNANYCQACGYDITDWHTSTTRLLRKKGHKTDATSQNNMSRSQKNKDLVKWEDIIIGNNSSTLKHNKNVYYNATHSTNNVDALEDIWSNGEEAVVNLGTTGNSLETDSLCYEKQVIKNDGITVMPTNGYTMD